MVCGSRTRVTAPAGRFWWSSPEPLAGAPLRQPTDVGLAGRQARQYVPHPAWPTHRVLSSWARDRRSAGRPAVQRRQGAEEVGAGRTTALGEDLVRAEHAARVEHLLDAAHQADRDRAEVFLKELLLQRADAVLTGERAAERQRRAEDRGRGLLNALHLARVAPVEEDIRMQVAVARVTENGDRQANLGADLPHAADHLRHLATRYGDVLAQLVRSHPAQRAGDGAPCLPQGLALRGAGRDGDRNGAVAAADLGHALDLGPRHRLVATILLEDQHRLGVAWQAHVQKIF